jgi:hypothetical protein
VVKSYVRGVLKATCKPFSRYAPWISARRAENFVLQELQGQKTGVYRRFLGGPLVSDYRCIECCMEG